MSEFNNTVRILFNSFRESVMGLLDTEINADDLMGLLWLGVIGLVVALGSSLLRALDKRRPMGG